MKISILIPTHNRPLLFQRCLLSVLNQTSDVEIIVNNDSNDITEIVHPSVKYYYNKFDNLSQVYQFLLGKATGEYVYYLEDDDYLTSGFFGITLDADLICGNYMPMWQPNAITEYMMYFTNKHYTDGDQFLEQVSFWHLQLSQYIFKRSVIQDYPFVMNSDNDNDAILVRYAARHAKTIKTIPNILFYQTTDGGDNISFPKKAATI